jgi:hypothetical protein
VRLAQYLREPVRDKSGTCLPLSRLDLGLSLLVTVAAMTFLLFVFQPFTASNVLKSLLSALLFLVLVALSTHKSSVVGIAAGIVAIRCIIGWAIFHQWTMGAASIGFGVVAFLMLRRL